MSDYVRKVSQYLRELKEGDNSNFGELYQITYAHMFSVALHYLIDKIDLEDVVADMYLRVMRYIHTYKPEQDGVNWMCKIVQNVAYAYNNKRYAEMRKCLAAEEAAELNAQPPNDWIEKDDLVKAISELTPAEQKLVFERFWLDQSFDEMAKEMHMTRSGAYKRVIKIVQKLNKIMSD